jgi:hypothetical protein
MQHMKAVGTGISRDDGQELAIHIRSIPFHLITEASPGTVRFSSAGSESSRSWEDSVARGCRLLVELRN